AQKEACIEKNKADAIADVTKAVRSNYDTSKHFTKMGDSLSDFVDLYGVVDPRKVYGVPIGDVAGYYDGLPFYMDKWDDYLSIGAGLPAGYRQGYQVSNYAKYGFTTKDVMKTLGINLNEEAVLKWEIKSDSTGCIQTRQTAVEWGVVDGISESKSAPRSNLMIGGNDVMNSFVANSTWLPFLNKHNADLVLTNITTIADWHLENGTPINAMGEWAFRVRLIDARRKTMRKKGGSASHSSVSYQFCTKILSVQEEKHNWNR
ncbi:MAG TPA: hypothetical protein PKK94_29320, partial [Leptospiraceae bacterium]|nr:hypothetical protein [Leptospiraceae bacterium]